jgi:hypothetical protein
MSLEHQRLEDPAWRQWGPYVSDRQWGTVREDYSANGDAWNYTTHDMARSYAYRWGEDGIAGFCDDKQQLCLGLSLWNGRDPILKERYFGLTNGEGNHGEDVKELYYYLDATPTHSYQRMLYKYPQRAYPYEQIVRENRHRNRLEPEFELLDTGIFDDDRYFDVYVEYAKAGPQDILMKVTVHNRAQPSRTPSLLPCTCCQRFGFEIRGTGATIRMACPGSDPPLCGSPMARSLPKGRRLVSTYARLTGNRRGFSAKTRRTHPGCSATTRTHATRKMASTIFCCTGPTPSTRLLWARKPLRIMP